MYLWLQFRYRYIYHWLTWLADWAQCQADLWTETKFHKDLAVEWIMQFFYLYSTALKDHHMVIFNILAI